MNKLNRRLEEFTIHRNIKGKGPLSVMLVLTRRAKESSPPYRANSFLSPKGGQVAGLGRSAVQAILANHGISRVLAEEGGRTSRGSINNMRSYIDFLNALANEGMLDFAVIERWWIDRVKDFFASQPFKLKVDSSHSLRKIVRDLIDSAFDRQKECPGATIVGTVLQHLVGAKLTIALPDVRVECNGSAVADAPADRKGDFLVGDTAIHVTTAPSEGLVRKCCANLNSNLHPLIITTETGMGGALALARNADVADRIEILEIEQFVATNVLEWSFFQQARRSVSVRELVDCYNRIISECETDPSLKIEIG